MSWNYRVFRNGPEGDDNTSYSIREVYYDEGGKPQYWSQEPEAPVAYSDYEETTYDKSLRWELEAMLKALDLPVLTKDDFPE